MVRRVVTATGAHQCIMGHQSQLYDTLVAIFYIVTFGQSESVYIKDIMLANVKQCITGVEKI